MTLTAGIVAQVSPAGSVVFADEVRLPDGRVGVCCSDSAIFDSVTCLRAWATERGNPKGIVRTVVEYAARAAAPPPVTEAGEAPPMRG